jgi:hypothetical protein
MKPSLPTVPSPRSSVATATSAATSRPTCWAKGGGKEGQGPKKNKDKSKVSAAAEEEEVEAWVVVEEVPAEEDLSEITAAPGSSPARPERVNDTATELYDSGASRHMSPFRARLSSPIRPSSPTRSWQQTKACFTLWGQRSSDRGPGW